MRGGAGLVAEAAGEGAGGHQGAARERVDAVLLGDVLEDPGEQRPEGVGVAVGDGPRDVLRLAAVAVRRYDGAPGDHARHGCAVLLPPDVQAGVEPGGGAGAGDDLAGVDVEHLGHDLRQRVAALQLLGVHPVRGALAAVEQPGRAEGEGPAADREDPGAAVVGLPDGVQHRLRAPSCRAAGRAPPPGRRRARARGPRRPAARSPSTSGSGPGDSAQTANSSLGTPCCGAVEPERLAQHPELERGHALVGKNRDVGQHGAMLAPLVAENQRTASFLPLVAGNHTGRRLTAMTTIILPDLVPSIAATVAGDPCATTRPPAGSTVATTSPRPVLAAPALVTHW